MEKVPTEEPQRERKFDVARARLSTTLDELNEAIESVNEMLQPVLMPEAAAAPGGSDDNKRTYESGFDEFINTTNDRIQAATGRLKGIYERSTI